MGKRIRLLLLTMLFVLSCGCGNRKKDEIKNPDVVFTYGESNVSKGEVYIYMLAVKERYEKEYGEDVWNMSLPENAEEGTTMEALTRQEVINEIVRVKTFAFFADECDVRLSETEERKIQDDTDEFYSHLTDADKQEMQINKDIVYTVMYENTLANRVAEVLLEDNSVEISDEEARMTTFYDMYFPCYTVDASGNVEPYTDEEKRQQYETALDVCSTLGTSELDGNEAGGDIESLASVYSLKESKEYTLTPDEILETYGQDIFDIIYEMNDGQYTTVVESEYGYHIFQMREKTDVAATAERKAELTQAAVQAKYDEQVSKWKKEIDPEFSYPESVNLELYDSIKIVNK